MRYEGIQEIFPGLCVAEGVIRGLDIKERSDELEKFKPGVTAQIRNSYTIENVKDDPVFRAYRDFFWSVGVDPTKTRPASEALVRRILAGKDLPTINTAVDAYNLASAESGVPIAAFDADMLKGDLVMRFASSGERFMGIGMKEPVALKSNQVIVCDADKIIAIYPYRDSGDTRVTQRTKKIRLFTCGVPGISGAKIAAAYRLCTEYVDRYSAGIADDPVLYP